MWINIIRSSHTQPSIVLGTWILLLLQVYNILLCLSFHYTITMATKALITIQSFLGFMTVFTMASAQSPNYMNDDCHNSTTQQALTLTYQTNLHNTLLWLSSDAATSKGYNHTTTGNGTVDAVYGLYDCRGDVTGSFCQFCVSTAASEILQRCPNKSSAVIWYNYCILR